MICEKELEWKKSTTYTMLKRLCERGIFKNENGIVSSLMTKAEFGAAQSEKFVEDTFEGSLPAFLAAFTTRKKLSKAEIDEIRQFAVCRNFTGSKSLHGLRVFLKVGVGLESFLLIVIKLYLHKEDIAAHLPSRLVFLITSIFYCL